MPGVVFVGAGTGSSKEVEMPELVVPSVGVATLGVFVSTSIDQGAGNLAMNLPNASEGRETGEKDRELHVEQVDRRYRADSCV